jgi:hypothetical protein
MPVNTPNAEFLYWIAEWTKIRAFTAGSKAVKEAGESFLPKLDGMTAADYSAYKLRAEVYGAMDRTIDGMEGAIFRKEPRIETPEDATTDAILKDVTQSGVDLKSFARDITREVMGPGRFGVLVDYPADPGEKARPYLVPYSTEKIVNWQTETINGRETLVLVVLEEPDPISSQDGFTQVSRKRYRCLRLIGGVYTVQIWTAKDAAAAAIGGVVPAASNTVVPAGATRDEYVMTTQSVPQRTGQALDAIPFFFFSPSGGHSIPQKPPLLDIADLCVQHYMASADYAHGLHYVALPFYYAFGVDKSSKLALGPSAALISENENAKCGIVEFTGGGLGAFENRLKSLEHKMAILGARLLEEQKREAETAEAMKMRSSGDESVLSGIAQAVGEQLALAVSRLLWWAGPSGDAPEVTIELNRDYVASAMDPAMLTALIQARQAGEISRETFLWNMHRGEVLPPDRTVEEEATKLETEAPALGGPGAAGAGDSNGNGDDNQGHQ